MLYQEGLKTLRKGFEKGASKNQFLKSGFKKFDKKFGGIYKKGVTVIGGAYQEDLTNLGVSLLKNISINQDIPTYYISFHDIELDIVKKITSSFLKIKMKKIISGKLSKSEKAKIDKLLRANRILPTYIINNIKRTTIDITYLVKNLIFEKKPNLILIDRFNEVQGNRNDKIKLIESLKSISQNTGVPFILLYELGDGGNINNNGRKAFFDNLNADLFLKSMSDCIVYLDDAFHYVNDEKEESKVEKGIIKLIVRKSKYGKTGNIKLRYKNTLCLFEDISE
jgi:replicative DNA helicase